MDIKNAGKKMKKIVFIILLSIVFIGCEDFRSRGFTIQNKFDIMPHQTSFKKGDTLWLKISFPRNLKNDDFNVNIDVDTAIVEHNIILSKLNSFYDTLSLNSVILEVDDMFFKKGERHENTLLYEYIWDEDAQFFIAEFGFVLQDTGKFLLANSNFKDFEYNFFTIKIRDVPGLGYFAGAAPSLWNNKKPGLATVVSVFEINNNGWFEFEVTE